MPVVTLLCVGMSGRMAMDCWMGLPGRQCQNSCLCRSHPAAKAGEQEWSLQALAALLQKNICFCKFYKNVFLPDLSLLR